MDPDGLSCATIPTNCGEGESEDLAPTSPPSHNTKPNHTNQTMAISATEAHYIIESSLHDFPIDGRSRNEHAPIAPPLVKAAIPHHPWYSATAPLESIYPDPPQMWYAASKPIWLGLRPINPMREW